MQSIGQIIATWLGIILAIAGAIAGYVRLKAKVEELDKKTTKAEESAEVKQAEFIKLETKIEDLEKRQEEDRQSAHKNFDRFFNAQNELSSVLREVSTTLGLLNDNFSSRLGRLESKLDALTTIKNN